MQRTAFVGRSWQHVLLCAGQDRAAAFVRLVYSWCAAAGQLRNDLRNTTSRESSGGGIPYSDVYDGRVTAVSGLLLQRVEGADRHWLLDHVWGRHPSAAEAHHRLEGMVDGLGVRADVVAAVRRYAEQIRGALAASGLRDDVGIVWDAWITRQIEVGVYRDYSYTDSSIEAFHRAVTTLRAVQP